MDNNNIEEVMLHDFAAFDIDATAYDTLTKKKVLDYLQKLTPIHTNNKNFDIEKTPLYP